MHNNLACFFPSKHHREYNNIFLVSKTQTSHLRFYFKFIFQTAMLHLVPLEAVDSRACALQTSAQNLHFRKD